MANEELIVRAGALELAGQHEPALELHRRILEEAPDAPATLRVRAGELALQLRRADEAASHFALAADAFEGDGLSDLALAMRLRVLRADPSRVDDYRRLAELAASVGYVADARFGCLGFADRVEADGGDSGPAVELLRAHLGHFPGDDEARRRLSAMGVEVEAPTPPPAEEAAPALDLLPTLLAGGDAPETPASSVAAAAAPRDAGALPALEGLLPTSAAEEWGEPAPAPDPEAGGLPLLDAEADGSDEPAAIAAAARHDLPSIDDDADDGAVGIAPLPSFGAEDAPAPDDGERDAGSDDLPILGFEGAAEDEGPGAGEPVAELEPLGLEAGPDAGSDESLAASLPDLAGEPPAAPEAGSKAEDAGGDFIDLGAFIFGDEEEAETRVRVDVLEPEDGQEADLQEILDLFREKVAQTIDPGDSASHFDLGLAFKEMGLYDDAIGQLQCALRGGSAPLPTLEALGECFVQKGEHALAVRVLERATRRPDAQEHELIGVVYFLGVCHEALGQPRLASECYERVVAYDIGFRDAASRLDAIRRSEVAAAL